MRVLIIDDEPHLRMSLEQLLGLEHEATSSPNAQAALSRLQAGERFDVILCDLMMPVMDGMALHEALGALDPDQQSRMVFMTGGAYTQRSQEFFARNTVRRLDKPFEYDDLDRLMKSVTRRE